MDPTQSSLFRALFGLLLVLCLHLGFDGSAAATDTAFVGARLYPAPDAAPIENGVVVVSDGKIKTVGPADQIAIPEGAIIIRADGKTITGGLWNSHVHFNFPPLDRLENEQVASYVRDISLQYGFVHVLDTGSAPGVSAELRRRIDTGEMAGPTILMANGSLVPKGSTLFYVRPTIMPDVAVPDKAQEQVDLILRSGAEGVKIFSGSIVSFTNIVPMDVESVRGIVDAAHKRAMFVVAHPTNNAGAWAAINGGVDILAHTFPQQGWDRSIPLVMLERNVALIPTLKLWRFDGERFGTPEAVIVNSTRAAQEQLAAFSDLGGQILFGTDVGYVTDFDPTDEYLLMQQAGLSFAQILASLTTAPAQRFGMADRTGKLEVGMNADLVVFDEDPGSDITVFAEPRVVVRRGQIVFER